MDERVRAAVCYFATDIHSGTLGKGGDDSLKRVEKIKGELVMVSFHATASHPPSPYPRSVFAYEATHDARSSRRGDVES